MKKIVNSKYIENIVMRPQTKEKDKRKMHVAFIMPLKTSWQ
jgi:hypothetical protein